MKMIETLPRLRRSRNLLLTFGLIVLGAYGAYQAAQDYPRRRPATLAYAAMFLSALRSSLRF